MKKVYILILIGIVIAIIFFIRFLYLPNNHMEDAWGQKGYSKEEIEILSICKNYTEDSDYFYKDTINFVQVNISDIEQKDLDLVDWMEKSSSKDSSDLLCIKFGNTADHNYIYLIYDVKGNEVVGIIPNK